MTFKKIVSATLAICITAIHWIALCGCEDLGAYDDVSEYYGAFGDIVMIGGTTGEKDEYSVEDYFYNEESREDFLEGEDGAYKGVEHSDYVYVAIPLESSIDMDTLALFLMSEEDAVIYISVFITDKIPSEWRAIADNVIDGGGDDGDADGDGSDTESDGGSNTEAGDGSDTESGEDAEEEKEYDDPDPSTSVGEIAVFLEKGKWDSFVLDTFNVNGEAQKSILINDGQYILLQIRNNSGVRIYNEDKGAFVDPVTGLELPRVVFTVTNLLVRALEVKSGDEAEGDN